MVRSATTSLTLLWGRFWSANRTPEFARIHHRSSPRERLEIQHIPCHLNQHKSSIAGESPVCQACLCQAIRAQLSRRTFGEVINSLFRPYTLINVVMARKYDVHTILDK